MPGTHASCGWASRVPADAPSPVAALADQARRLNRAAWAGACRSRSIARANRAAGSWRFPWHERDEAETIAEAAFRLARRRGPALRRAIERARGAAEEPPEWVTDAAAWQARKVPLISISGTNGKSTTTRMISHIARLAGKHVGTTTTDGVLIDERLVEPGDYTGPAGARAVLNRPDVDLAVLETARGGILLRGLGYESNESAC